MIKDNDVTKKKPRIQIKLRKTDDNNKSESNDVKKERKKPLKRKRDDEEEDEMGVVDVDHTPIPRKRQKDSGLSKKKAAKTDHSGDATAPRSTNGASNVTPKFLDLKFWKDCRESLNGTFKAARKNLTQFDGWTLPEDVVDKFTEIANCTIEKMNK